MCHFKRTFLHLKGGKLKKNFSWLEPNLVIFSKVVLSKKKKNQRQNKERVHFCVLNDLVFTDQTALTITSYNAKNKFLLKNMNANFELK